MGLASRAYCHFTSPIRRYSDLVCHRALLGELGVSDEPVAPDDLSEIAEHISVTERAAAQLEYRADEICLIVGPARRRPGGGDRSDKARATRRAAVVRPAARASSGAR